MKIVADWFDPVASTYPGLSFELAERFFYEENEDIELTFNRTVFNIPGFEQLGSPVKVKTFPFVQVTSLLPLNTAPESVHVTFTTVPESTGN